MARLAYDEINKDDFVRLLLDMKDYKSSTLHDCYFQLMVDKLKEDTDLHFYYRGGEIISESLGIKISDVTSYDDLLTKVEKQLSLSVKDNNLGIDSVKLANDWGYVFSNSGMSPFYFKDSKVWKVYDSYAQSAIFELWYFGLFGKWHKDMAFCHNLADAYLVTEDWNKPKTYRGPIHELDNIDVMFLKNGNIKIKSKMPQQFWDNIDLFYSICDPKNNLVRNK